MTPPYIVGLGGTVATNSSSERVLAAALTECELLGARTRLFNGPAIDLPNFAPGRPLPDTAADLVAALRRADGIIVASPGYHGSVSGLVKNALDYTEEMARDSQPYFEGRAVGLIAVAAGWQATGSTLATLRAIIHALRGWPTPIGIAVNSANPVFAADGRIEAPQLTENLRAMAQQLVDFAAMRRVVGAAMTTTGPVAGDK